MTARPGGENRHNLLSLSELPLTGKDPTGILGPVGSGEVPGLEGA